MQKRIAKSISDAGICSRRQAEVMIQNGMVTVDGVLVTSPATKVDEHNVVTVDGVEITQQPKKTRLWRYYKPRGILTSHGDPYNRPTVFEQLKSLPRVISIGRLDLDSEGLLLLTNDGALARYMESPKTVMERVYMVRAYGDYNSICHAKGPLVIDGVTYNPKLIKIHKKGKSNHWFEVILTEGKNREIRKIFSYYGLAVNRLIRTQYSTFVLGELEPNEVQEVLL